MNRAQTIFCVALIAILASEKAGYADLTGQYLFEEGSGTTALDTATNPAGDSRNGTLMHAMGDTAAGSVDVVGGPTYTAGLYKGSQYALLFNSDDRDRVALPQNQDFIRNASGATIMAWVRYDTPLPYDFATQKFPVIVQINNGTTVADPISNPNANGARASISDSHNFFFRSVGSKADEGRNGTNSVVGGCQNSPDLCTVTGKTYFVVGVFDYVNGTNTIYVDGVPAIQNIVPGWNGTSADQPNLYASIGAAPVASGSSTVAWTGAIDGVRIYNTALDATTILNTYNAELIQPVLGDYNGNGVVDAADYVLWREGSSAADGTGPSGTPDGAVNNLDYDFWRSHFGNTSNPTGASLAPSIVPEPPAIAIVIVLCLMSSTQRRWRNATTKSCLADEFQGVSLFIEWRLLAYVSSV